MKKILIIMLMFLFLTVTGCSQEKDKSEIGDSTTVSDNEIGEGNESISDIGINLVKKGQTLEIDDKEYMKKFLGGPENW